MVSQFFLTTTAQKVRALIHSSMKVSVVIPAFNEARLLGETLRLVGDPQSSEHLVVETMPTR